jgi:release factor glutamine methyltransferase
MENQTTITTETDPPRLRDLLSQGVGRLASAGIESARLDAEVLLADALAMTREQLLVAAHSALRAEQVQRFEALLLRRLRREPVAYITGRREFWSLDFQVTRDVLIPRPETERLIEVALLLGAEMASNKPARVLDIGTGSGAIAVSLAKEMLTALIYATDISPAALAVARRNALLHGVADRMTFFSSDMLAALGEKIVGFDLLVSNPPYIRRAEIDALEPEVRDWEPRGALDGGADGLKFYRPIAAQAWRLLKPGGAVVLEIDTAMGRQVAALFHQAESYREVAIMQDYAGRDRVVVAKAAPPAACPN